MPNILSIQSWVAYGHVGNAAATFPLQRLGFEVWAIHTVQFSNHPGYGAWKGQVFAPAMIGELVEGIADRGVLGTCDGVLSGYLGDPAVGRQLLGAVDRVRQANPAALFCCDPVIGDVGRGVYVQPGLPEFFRDQVVPRADIITPNQFELEFLSGTTIETLDQALAAVDAVRATGPRTVLVTSLQRREAPADVIELLAVGADGAYLVATPLLPIAVNGAGDALSALFFAHLLRTGDLALALENAVAALHAVLAETVRSGAREIQLIAAQDEIVQPTRRFGVHKVR